MQMHCGRREPGVNEDLNQHGLARTRDDRREETGEMGMDRSYRVLLDPCVKNFDVALYHGQPWNCVG